MPNGKALGFYCPKCAELLPYEKCGVKKFEASAVPRTQIAAAARSIGSARAYKLEKSYKKRYLAVTVIMLCAEVSCFYIARVSAVRLFLPLAVGYFLYVSAVNLITALCTRYYVTETGVVQRVLWGYSMYPIGEKASLVHFSDGVKIAWGLYTEKENLLISPIISDYEAMLSELKARCSEQGTKIIE